MDPTTQKELADDLGRLVEECAAACRAAQRSLAWAENGEATAQDWARMKQAISTMKAMAADADEMIHGKA